MLFTLATALLAAASSVVAAPAVDVEARQAGGIRGTFYKAGGCSSNGWPGNTPWVDDTYFVQNPVGQCAELTTGNPFEQTYFNQSTITRTLRFYNDHGCVGNYLEISPSDGATPGCKSQVIKSWITL